MFAADPQPLHDSIELVLLDHADQLDGEWVDANLKELAYVYRRRTGWTVSDEGADPPPS